MKAIFNVSPAVKPFALWVVINVLCGGLSRAVSAEALSFDAALALAVSQAPVLSARAHQIDAAKNAIAPSDALPDPRLAIGVENLPIDGADAFNLTNDFMTMERIGVSQEFPNARKRHARLDGALAKVTVMEARARLARQGVLREAAVAWIARATVEQQLELIQTLVAENELFDRTVRAAYAGGQGQVAELVLPRQEAAALAERQERFQARRAQAIATLRQWIGDAAELPLSGDSPVFPLDRQALTHRLHEHPEIAAFESAAHVLDADVAEAAADKWPDWGVEFAYQHRGARFSDMVMLQFSVDLPLFAESRQNPRIAAKVAQRRALDAERDASLREHQAMLERDFAEYIRLSHSATRYRAVLLPLAEEKIALTLAAWRGGQGTLAQVLAARRERIEIQLKARAIAGTRAELAARLHYSYAQPDDARLATLNGAQP